MGSGASKSTAHGRTITSSTLDNLSQDVALNSSPRSRENVAQNSTSQNVYFAQALPTLAISVKKLEAAKKKEKEKAMEKILQQYPDLAESLTFARERTKEVEKDVEGDVKRRTMSLRSKKWFEELYLMYFEHEPAEHKKIIGDQLARDKGGQIATEYIKALTDDGKSTPTEGYSFECLVILRANCWNYSDASLEFCTSLGRMGVFPLLIADLKTFYKDLDNSNIRCDIILPCMSILHNCAKAHENKRFLKEAAAVEAIVPYTKIEDPEIKMISLMTLAYVIEEKDNEIISADGSMIKFILGHLQRAIKSSDHKCEGFSALEIVSGLMHLASNDSNKAVIVNAGMLPMLVELMQKGDDSEKTSCAETVWVLSFGKDNKEKIRQETNMISVLKELQKTSGAAKENASGALWVLGDEERIKNFQSSLGNFGNSLGFKKKKYKKMKKDVTKKDVQSKEISQSESNRRAEDSVIEVEQEKIGVSERSVVIADISDEDEAIPPCADQASATPKHIMISYQWNCQKLMIRLKQRLEKLNYLIWIDIESMGGSTLQAMAEAVENSDAVLICMSQKYKESPNCRTEAEYAYKLGKTLVPLRVEPMYQADGWLGALQGAKFYFDFSNMMSFESVFSKLTKELGDRGKSMSTEVTDGPSSPIVTMPTFSSPILPPLRRPELYVSVKQWTKDHVEQWAVSNKIASRKFASFDGESLIFLHSIKQTAPEFFYKYASDKLGFSDFRDLMNLCKGLDELDL